MRFGSRWFWIHINAGFIQGKKTKRRKSKPAKETTNLSDFSCQKQRTRSPRTRHVQDTLGSKRKRRRDDENELNNNYYVRTRRSGRGRRAGEANGTGPDNKVSGGDESLGKRKKGSSFSLRDHDLNPSLPETQL